MMSTECLGLSLKAMHLGNHMDPDAVESQPPDLLIVSYQ